MLEHQTRPPSSRSSGPGGLASFLRCNLLGKGLNRPSLPLDVGQTNHIAVTCGAGGPADQGCGFPGGGDQPAAGDPYYLLHRPDGGPTSQADRKN